MPSGRARFTAHSMWAMTDIKVRTHAPAEPQRVAFDSEDVELVGHIRSTRTGRPQPGIVLTGPFTGVKEQVVGTVDGLIA